MLEERTIMETKMVGPIRPVLQTWVDASARFANQLVLSGFAAARDIHGEWKERVRELIDLVENSQKGTISLTRRLVGHFDTVVTEALRSGEESVQGVVRSVEATAIDATNIAARTGTRWVGERTGSERAA
jgi:hypothetical protein